MSECGCWCDSVREGDRLMDDCSCCLDAARAVLDFLYEIALDDYVVSASYLKTLSREKVAEIIAPKVEGHHG